MKDDIFHLKPWTPKVQKAAKELTSRIHEIAPELEVLFMGAAALGLPGKNDIDLDIICSMDDIDAYTLKLNRVLGSPKESKPVLTAWKFEYRGFEIDAILSDPRNSHVPLQRKRFEILKNNAELRNEYRKLKEDSDGLPYSLYEKRKADFLENKVFSSKT